MAAPIGPGDWCEFLGPPSPEPGAETVVVGGLYCVEAFVASWGACNHCGDDTETGLILAGQPRVPCGGTLMSWCPCRFRPVYRPRASFIASLKAPPKRQKTPEVVGANSRDDIPNLSPREVEVA
jgi:hypothetical protein